MWENPISKSMGSREKSSVLMKKHYKNGLMLGVLLLAMFSSEEASEPLPTVCVCSGK